MKKWINDIFYSFPIQLLILHSRNNLVFIFSWIFLAFLMTGKIGSLFGIKYLFLTPEYLGQVNCWSFFLLGFAFGSFMMTWNLTTYLLEAYHFPFLASLGRPFTKFCLNNSVIPLIFLGCYMFYSIHYQWYYEYWNGMTIAKNIMGFGGGLSLMLFITSVYFQLTNKDVMGYLKLRSKRPPNTVKTIAPGRRGMDVERVKMNEFKWRVDTYLSEFLKPRLTRSVAHYDTSILMSVFKQNHVNALIAQLFGLVSLVALGYLIDFSYFRIPAAASLFILFSVFISLIGAITYWFSKWRIPVVLALLFGINFITGYDMFNHKNRGYGLDYTVPPAVYNYEELQKVCHSSNIKADKQHTEKILNNWSNQVSGGHSEKPKMVIFCVSGGGMKASVWSMHVMQQADSIMNGGLMEHTALITGASGGLMGAAYYRELSRRKALGEPINIYSKKYIDLISKDLLNSLTFTIVSNDLFMPRTNFELDGFKYKKDRGYIFEKQFSENTNNIWPKYIKDYKKPEEDAIIPMMFITPSIVNDGRRLIISPHGVSYMTIAPIGVDYRNAVEIDAVDFGHFFRDQKAENLLFTSALRMNATYPYILPNVHLPSIPELEVMDAGFRDNYGIVSATRFIHVFKDWIKENTSGVVLVQVSGMDKIKDLDPDGRKGAIETMLNPLGIAGQILELQDFEQDTNIGFIYDILGKDMFEVIRFFYRPTDEDEKASMTFHLNQREKDDILNSFYLEENQDKLKRLMQVLGRNHNHRPKVKLVGERK